MLLFVSSVAWIIKQQSKDNETLIREITKSLLAANITEYAEATPEDGEEEEAKEPDEFEDVGTVDEKLLIKHLKEGYASNKD